MVVAWLFRAVAGQGGFLAFWHDEMLLKSWGAFRCRRRLFTAGLQVA